MNNELEHLIAAMTSSERHVQHRLSEIHTDQRIRKLAKLTNSDRGFPIIYSQHNWQKDLFYGKEGFAVNIPECIEAGNYRESGSYRAKWHKVTSQSDRLYICHRSEELVEVFPQLTPEFVEEKLIEGIQRLKLYDRVGGKK